MEKVWINTKTLIKLNEPIVACIGYFDGVHKGHQALIKKTLEIANKNQTKSAMITFDQNPAIIAKGLSKLELLTTLDDRIQLAQNLGIEQVIILEFDREMAKMSTCQFIDNILLRLPLVALVCGFDFKFGALASGNSQTLTNDDNIDFPVYVVDEIKKGQQKISSSQITNYLKNADIASANMLLGYLYSLKGTVINGRKKGREIGFPTANILLSDNYILPQNGVYAGIIEVEGKKYKTMINIGHNPTFNYRDDVSVEAHILDFDQDIYGEKVKLEFNVFLREECKFSNVHQLIAQLEIDRNMTQEYFRGKEI